jgi:hypothetical protein
MSDYTDIKDYRLMLSGQIKLNITDIKPNDHSNPPVRGAIFEDVYRRKEITFKDKLPGLAIDLQENRNDITLLVYFESKADAAKYPQGTHYLVFRAMKSDRNAFFYLDYPDNDIQYGGDKYNLLFNNYRPYLLINLDQKTKEETGGRNVGGNP